MMESRRIIATGLIAALLSGGALCYWRHTLIAERMERFAALRGEEAILKRQISSREGLPTASPGASLRSIDLPELVQTISHNLDDLKVLDRSLTTGPNIVHGFIQRTPLRLTFKSSFAAVFELLNRLNHNDSIVRLNRLVLVRDPKSAIDALSVAIDIETFSPTLEQMP